MFNIPRCCEACQNRPSPFPHAPRKIETSSWLAPARSSSVITRNALQKFLPEFLLPRGVVEQSLPLMIVSKAQPMSCLKQNESGRRWGAQTKAGILTRLAKRSVWERSNKKFRGRTVKHSPCPAPQSGISSGCGVFPQAESAGTSLARFPQDLFIQIDGSINHERQIEFA